MGERERRGWGKVWGWQWWTTPVILQRASTQDWFYMLEIGLRRIQQNLKKYKQTNNTKIRIWLLVHLNDLIAKTDVFSPNTCLPTLSNLVILQNRHELKIIKTLNHTINIAVRSLHEWSIHFRNLACHTVYKVKD